MGNMGYTVFASVPVEERSYLHIFAKFNSNEVCYDDAREHFESLKPTEGQLPRQTIRNKFFPNFFYELREESDHVHLKKFVDCLVGKLPEQVEWHDLALLIYPFLHFEVTPRVIPHFAKVFLQLVAEKLKVNEYVKVSQLQSFLELYFHFIVIEINELFQEEADYSIKSVVGETYDTIYTKENIQKLAEDFLRMYSTKNDEGEVKESSEEMDVDLDPMAFNKFASKGEKNWFKNAKEIRLMFFLTYAVK